MTKRALLLLCASALTAAADLPVREVVLYKHGVGYFERGGLLAPGESARLDFRTAEMNDVLKSLTITDAAGAKVSGLRYDSAVPLDEKLAGFPFTLLPGQALSGVLDQLKGARVELTLGGETLAGLIVSARVIPGDRDRAEREQVSLLLDSGLIRNFDLGAASALRFPDPKLQQQFRDYLAAVTAARSKDRRSVYIDSTDGKARDLRVSYLIPAPLWKSSYRLIFPPAGDPTLEGWAIVDNTTGEDWVNVKMSLVSGKPISFLFPLYEPRLIARFQADLPEDQAVRATAYEGALTAAPPPPPPPAPGVVGGVIGGIAGGMPGGVRKQQSFARAQTQAVSVESAPALFSTIPTSSTREIADLFEYRIERPVTVRKDESAMLPFLQQKIGARKLLIYSETDGVNPRNAAELTNTLGMTLDGGPITVFDAGAYAGEALVQTFKKGDKRFISYAVDLGTRISTLWDSGSARVREFHVNRGVATLRYSQVDTRTYTIRNVDPKAKTLILEQPVRPEYNLLNRKPAEKTATAYRFEVPLGAGAEVTYPVTEERVYSTSTALSSFTPDTLAVYLENKELSAAARTAIGRILDQKRQIAAAQSEQSALSVQINDLSRDEERLRNLLMSLNTVNGQQEQVQKYARQLGDRETQLDTLRARQLQAKDQAASLETRLNDLIANLDF